ncbi:hypothetical protein CVT24_012307 [Panaeolus cyanescens]|uniref:HNH nuclease domain-containing protein n=1 Tax=Panaeolus cyanescens TaxID=181874 RepID=A0A409WUC6_9AGAR|nr:hypothetical protein CVT24_012307 [Panaeolus cyanescens]
MMDILAPISYKAIKRAERADPNGARCLIENCSKERAVVLAHAYKREASASSQFIDILEWHWRLRNGALNFDTRRNIFFVGAALYQMYKQKKWVLIPEEDVINRYVYDYGEGVLREDFPVFEETTFKYRFLPVYDMEEIYIARQSSDSAAQVDIHGYPFDTMPTLVSHVHPTFVIMHTSSVFYSDLSDAVMADLRKRCPIVDTLRSIYAEWVSVIPTDAEDVSSYAANNSDNGNEDTESSNSERPERHLAGCKMPTQTNAEDLHHPSSVHDNDSRQEARFLVAAMSDIFEPILATAGERATKAGPNRQRCLIENCSNERAVELAHAFDREFSLDEGLLAGLEWHWGLKIGTLNLDTHRNIFFLGASLYKLYRQNKWVLLPEDDVLDRYVYANGRAVVREDFPVFQEKTFKYRFVPLFDMEDIYVARQSSDSLSQVDIHEYPFDTMPLLTSHVHPTFVLMHTSSVIHSQLILPPGALAIFSKRFPVVRRLKTLYSAWTSILPTRADSDPTYLPCSSLRRNDNSDDGYWDAESIDDRPQDLGYPNQFNQSQPPNLSSAYSQDERPVTPGVKVPESDKSSTESAQTPPQRIRIIFPSQKRLTGAYWNSESEAYQSATGEGGGSDGVERHVVPEVPIRYSARWNPDAIAEWARNSQIASKSVTDSVEC